MHCRMPGIQIRCQMVFTLQLQMSGNQMVFRWPLTLESSRCTQCSDGNSLLSRLMRPVSRWSLKQTCTWLILNNLNPCFDNSTITAWYSDALLLLNHSSCICHWSSLYNYNTTYVACLFKPHIIRCLAIYAMISTRHIRIHATPALPS